MKNIGQDPASLEMVKVGKGAEAAYKLVVKDADGAVITAVEGESGGTRDDMLTIASISYPGIPVSEKRPSRKPITPAQANEAQLLGAGVSPELLRPKAAAEDKPKRARKPRTEEQKARRRKTPAAAAEAESLLDGEKVDLSIAAEELRQAEINEAVATVKADEAAAKLDKAKRAARNQDEDMEVIAAAARRAGEASLERTVEAIKAAKTDAVEFDEPDAEGKIGAADENGIARPEKEPADFLMFIGGNFYTKETFINEAATMGISRRMPSHRLPSDLVSGKSRVFVAIGGTRIAGTDDARAEVFGYFTPDAVEFINTPPGEGADGEGGDGYGDIIATLKMRPDSRIVDTLTGEPERGCGYRKSGGTYLVVDKADSPLRLLAMPGTFVGNHFRGLMRLKPDQATALAEGGDVAVLCDENCMNCGAKVRISPSGAKEAARERARIDRGEEPKWRLLCQKCRRERAAEQAAERRRLKEEREASRSKAGPKNGAPRASSQASEDKDNVLPFPGRAV